MTIKIRKGINYMTIYHFEEREMRIVVEEKWETTLFYLATLTAVFIFGCVARLLLG